MEQRQLRLGDVLDDYCPRERRLTNHAIVAMIGDEVRQTRCLTCDSEHVYKGARVPARRRKQDAPAALYAEVLAGMAEADAPRGQLAKPGLAPAPVATGPAESGVSGPETSGEDDLADAIEAPPPAEEGPAHRPLIRATLPRIEGQAPGRPLPEFTIRQSTQRNGRGAQIRGPQGRQAGGQAGAFSGGKHGRVRSGRASGSGSGGGRRGADRFSPQAGQNRRQPFAPHGRKRSK